MTKASSDQSSWAIPTIVSVIGFGNRITAKLPILGKKTIAFSSKIAGKLLPSMTFLGFRKEASYENAIQNWELFLKLIGAEYTAENTAPNEKTYTITKCPAGYCRPGHLKACQATMELDHNLVKNSGARLVVEKRIPTDGVCVEKIVSL